MKLNQVIFFFCLTGIYFLPGCKSYDNFTTYYNTYYNSTRLMKEAEDEFEFQDEKKRITPRVIIPEPKFKIAGLSKTGTPQFMDEFVISQQKLQPVKIKLDSIIIKGSKVLAKHPYSNYVESSLYLMAKSYFYQSLWIPSQVKCSEIVDKFPDGDFVPDALLLMSENLLMQQNYENGSIMLSRTVDMAWQKKRWDILSEAFRLQAEIALMNNDIDGAIRPYKQAIAQSEDDVLRAKWQVDLASIYYKVSRFNQAEKEYAKVQDYTPDYMAAFEGYIYQAMSQIRTGDTTKATQILTMLQDDGKYEEWRNLILLASMTKTRLYGSKEQMTSEEKFADSAYLNNTAVNAVYFEKAVDFFNNKKYPDARKYFARSRNQRSVFSKTSERMFFLMNSWEQKNNIVTPMLAKLDSGQVLGDTSNMILAQTLFELGRVHEEIGNSDSSLKFYHLATNICPVKDSNRARYLYAYSRLIKNDNRWQSDSLLEIIAYNFPKTEYGKEAIKQLGYTDKYQIDPVYDLFSSGSSLRKNKEYYFAINQFLRIFNEYPESNFSPRSLYTIGWIYEHNLKNIDSAFIYYRLLLEKYPETVYAKELNSSVSYLLALRNGEAKPDQPRTYEKPTGIKLEDLINMPTTSEPPKKEGFNPLDILKNPGKTFENAIDNTINSVKDQGKDIMNKTMKDINNPKNFLPKLDIPGSKLPTEMPPDSAKKDQPLNPKK